MNIPHSEPRTGISWDVPAEGWTTTSAPLDNFSPACWVSTKDSHRRDKTVSVGGYLGDISSEEIIARELPSRDGNRRIRQLNELGLFDGPLLPSNNRSRSPRLFSCHWIETHHRLCPPPLHDLLIRAIVKSNLLLHNKKCLSKSQVHHKRRMPDTKLLLLMGQPKRKPFVYDAQV